MRADLEQNVKSTIASDEVTWHGRVELGAVPKSSSEDMHVGVPILIY